MLDVPGARLFVYPITRDLGFAPNPFHGVCSLATCKPKMRKSAVVGDWVLGIAGANYRDLRGKCIFLMQVTEKMGFDEYWNDTRFQRKRPVRNGSLKMLVGDNIYHSDGTGNWTQENSHHSNADGTTNERNLNRDTGSTDRVLLSDHFLYFGKAAVEIDLDSLNYGRIRDYCRFRLDSTPAAVNMVNAIVTEHSDSLNHIIADPIQFEAAYQRVDQVSGRMQ